MAAKKDKTKNAGERLFPPTDWKAIAGIADRSNEEQRCAALAQLWPQYQRGLRVFLRQKFALNPDDAQEALQSFILDKVLVGNVFAEADRGRGRFRTLLLSALENHVRSRQRRDHAAKRLPEGGWVSVEMLPEEEHPDGVTSPSHHLDQVWAETILNETAERMKEECRLGGRKDIWIVFEGRAMDTFLRRGRPVPYGTLAQLSGAQTVQKTRFLFNTGKRMFHRAVRTVLAELVSDPTRQEQELQDLAAILFRT